MWSSIVGGVNKLRRNWAARGGKTEFEQRLIKATFEKDEKEPKLKHVSYLLECLKGTNPDIKSKEAFACIFKKFQDSLTSWVHTMKVYTIFHVALQDAKCCKSIAIEIKAREHLCEFYKKPSSSASYFEANHEEASRMISQYVLALADAIISCDALGTGVGLDKFKEYLKKTPITTVFKLYDRLYSLVKMIGEKAYTNSMFYVKFRIYKNMLRQLHVDLVRFYKMMLIIIDFLFEYKQALAIEELCLCGKVHDQLIQLSDSLMLHVTGMMSNIKESDMPSLTFFTRNESMINELNDVLDQKTKMAEESLMGKAEDGKAEWKDIAHKDKEEDKQNLGPAATIPHATPEEFLPPPIPQPSAQAYAVLLEEDNPPAGKSQVPLDTKTNAQSSDIFDLVESGYSKE